jgi:hypothetical protein
MQLGLLLLVRKDFQQALEKELNKPSPFVFRHAVPFFSGHSVGAEVGEKTAVSSVRI